MSCTRSGQLKLRFRPAEEAAWLAWLREVSSFAFHGKGGSLNVYLEKRPRGGAYWYAYHTKEGRTRKRYLGQTESLSLARLEETARALSHEQQPAPATEQGMLLLSSQACSSATAERAGGARALADGTRWGAFDSADPALGLGGLGQNHAALGLGAAGKRRRSPGSRWTNWTIARPASGSR